MRLNKAQKQRVRDIAWKNLQSARKLTPMSPNQQLRHAARRTEEELLNRRYEFGSKGFGSIFTSILISLAIKLAIKLITKWVEDNYMGEGK
jgi:hypothetical protein